MTSADDDGVEGIFHESNLPLQKAFKIEPQRAQRSLIFKESKKFMSQGLLIHTF
jgi:hypothetical protein